MRGIFLLLVVYCCSVPAGWAQTSAPVLAYIEQYKTIAITEMLRTGVPASITLAQGILESQAGKSELATASNNHFGIKCKSDWTGDVYFYDDDSKQECFRSYASSEESFKDHSDFLRTRPNYSSLFNIPPEDFQAWAKGLKKAGYATNPVYAQKLIKFINDYNLQQYTLQALQANNEHEAFLIIPNTDTLYEEITEPVADVIIPEATLNAVESETVPELKNYPEGIFVVNNTRVVYARKGASLFALASEYGISFRKLIEYNDFIYSDILTRSGLVYLEKKSKKGSKEFHIVAPDETIESIAQTEAVQLESLLEYNDLAKGIQPSVGEKIYLQNGHSGNVNNTIKSTGSSSF